MAVGFVLSGDGFLLFPFLPECCQNEQKPREFLEHRRARTGFSLHLCYEQSDSCGTSIGLYSRSLGC